MRKLPSLLSTAPEWALQKYLPRRHSGSCIVGNRTTARQIKSKKGARTCACAPHQLGTLRPRLLQLSPAVVRIEPHHAFGNRFGVLAKILLVNHAGMTDHEGHHT